MKYWEIIWNGYTGYANYLWNEILHPGWHNYFYWLIGLSLFFWILEILFPWRKNQSFIRKRQIIMNNHFIKSFILILFLFPFCSIGQTKLTAEQLDALLSSDKTVQLIDVRTPGEIAQGYINGSKHMDYSSPDFAKKLNTLDKSRPVAVYCAVGGRSGKTAQKLIELGFKKIYDFPGGMTEWKAKQKPTVKP